MRAKLYAVKLEESTYVLDGNRLARAALNGLVHLSEGPASSCQPENKIAGI